MLTISTNPLVEDRLERLVFTGCYGKNAAEAAERLLSQTLNTVDKQGEIPTRPKGRVASMRHPKGRKSVESQGDGPA